MPHVYNYHGTHRHPPSSSSSSSSWTLETVSPLGHMIWSDQLIMAIRCYSLSIAHPDLQTASKIIWEWLKITPRETKNSHRPFASPHSVPQSPQFLFVAVYYVALTVSQLPRSSINLRRLFRQETTRYDTISLPSILGRCQLWEEDSPHHRRGDSLLFLLFYFISFLAPTKFTFNERARFSL